MNQSIPKLVGALTLRIFLALAIAQVAVAILAGV